MAWIITSTEDNALAWSNQDGWTAETFETFTDEEHESLSLPMGGEWAWVPWRCEEGEREL